MKRPLPRQKLPRPQPARIEVRPHANDPVRFLEDILKRIATGGKMNTYCNLSPLECDLLIGSFEATTDALDSAECVVRQVARETYGKAMTVKEFADAAGYDS